jgi:metal-sulfur cluster biosynthetic enzyme
MEEITDINPDDYKKDYVANAGNPIKQGVEVASREAIIEALKTVSDPEIMINIWDMGLVYKIEQKENADVYIEMTVTSPMCPVAGVLPQQAADAVASLDGVGKVEVKIVWEPAWSLANLSDEAREMFELF